MPYMVQLPLMETQDWNTHPVYRDLASQMFQKWYEYLARSICSVHKDSDICVGYLVMDIPGRAEFQYGIDFSGLEGLENNE